jgi:etoposide-induced 2.4 mRNA
MAAQKYTGGYISGTGALYALAGAAPEAASELASGFVDSISLHRALPAFLGDRKVLTALGKCLAVNVILLLGSVYVHDKVLLPVTDLIRDNLVSLGGDSAGSSFAGAVFDLSKQGLTMIYTSCWLIPVWGLCYALSLQWYQDIAQELLQLRSRTTGKRAPDVKNKMVQEGYVLVAWLILYGMTHVLLTGIPKISVFLVKILDMTSLYFGDGTVTNFLFFGMRSFVSMSHIASRTCGYMVQGICYGWYGFDYHWAADGEHYKMRFKRVEDHWAYFLGFGCPYVLIMHQTSFLVGFGLYLMLFPFTIVLSASADYAVSYNQVGIPPVHIFELPGHFANIIIKFVLSSTGSKMAENSKSGSKKTA